MNTRRSHYFIDKNFQLKFILKFCIIVVASSILIGLTSIIAFSAPRATSSALSMLCPRALHPSSHGQNFSSIFTDSTTALSVYVTTNTGSSLQQGTTYWWRAQWAGNSLWSSTRSFVVDIASPTFSGIVVSTSASVWYSTGGVYLSSSVVAVKINVQQSVFGL